MPTAYAQLYNDVTTILRNNVRFSSAVRSVNPLNDDTTLRLSPVAIVFDDSYYGLGTLFEFRFFNNADLTEYELYQQINVEGARNLMFLTTGHTNADLVVPGIFTIPAAAWSGAAQYEDIIHLVTDSHMSVEQAESIINDVEAWVDDVLRINSIIHMDEGAIPNDLYFAQNPPVPRQIKNAVAHISAFRIMNYVFDASKAINPMNAREEGKTQLDYAIAYKWLKVGEQSLKDWLNMYKVQNAGNAPRWTSVPSFQDTVGVYDTPDGIGIKERQTDANPLSDTNDASYSIDQVIYSITK